MLSPSNNSAGNIGNTNKSTTRRARLNPLPSIPLQCLTPIEGKLSTDADLSARNVTHRLPEVFEDIVGKSTQILKKKVSAQAGYSGWNLPADSQMGGGGSISSAQHSVSTQYNRGYALYRLQQYAQAAEDFLACSRSDPDRAAPAFYNRGCALYKLGRHTESVRALTKALKLDSKNPLFVESRARVLKEMGKFEEAIHDYTWLDALRHHPAASLLKDPSQSILLEAVCSPSQQSTNRNSTSSAASLAYEAQESSAKAWIEEFLKQDPGRTRRTPDVVEAARLARCWSFFRGMRVAMIERCMRDATYYRFESDQVVVDQGRASASFHLVLDAVASLVKTVTFQGTSSRELSTLYQGDTIGLEPSSATNVDGRLVMLRHRAQRQLMMRTRVGSVTSPLLASIRSLGGFQTNSFNAVGSIARAAGTLHPKETATFSSLGEVNCMLLDMDVYLNILREDEERLLEERLQFLHRCHAFGTCTDKMLADLAVVSGSKLVDPDKEALKTGEVVKQLYVIKKGVCHVMKTITVPHSSPHRSTKLTGSKSEDALTSRSTDGSWVLDNGWMLTNPRLVSNAQALAAARLQHTEEVTVAVLASGQLFGELSVLQPGQHSPVTVRTQTLVELLVFEEEDLSQLRVQYMSGTMNALQESLLFHNPPQQKLAQLRCDLTLWSREKRSVLEELFPPGSPVTKSPFKKTAKSKKPVKPQAPELAATVSIPTLSTHETLQRPLTSPTTGKRSALKAKVKNTRRSIA